MTDKLVCMIGFSCWLCGLEARDVSYTGVGVCEEVAKFLGWLMGVGV